MDRYIEEYVNYLGAIKNYSPTTVKTYRSNLRSLCRGANIKCFEDITVKNVEGYFGNRITEGKSVVSNLSAVVCLRQLLKFCNKRGYCNISPDLFEPPKRVKKEVDYVTPEEVNLLLTHTSRERDRLMVLVMFTSSCRVNELVKMTAENFSGNKFSCIVKGRKQHVYYMDGTVADRLRAYMQMEGISEGHVFRTTTGKPIGQPSVYYAVKQAAAKSGIKKNIHPHIFRHGFATASLENGADPRTIQEMMGHEHIETTMRYMHVSDHRMQESHEQFAPKVSNAYYTVPKPVIHRA